jgi:hypothetical protein
VVDQRNSRLTVFGPDLQIAREARFPVLSVGSIQPLSLAPGLGLIMNGWIPTSEAAGMPLHRFSRTGRADLSFGADSGAGPASASGVGTMRILSPRSSSVFWSLRADEYRMEQWDLESGALIRTTVVEEDWVRDSYENHEPAVQNPSLFLSIWEEDGRLWVLGAEPEDMSGTAGPPRHGEPGRPRRDRGEIMDLRLEVVDTASGSILATQRLPHYAGVFMSTGQLVTFRSMYPPGQMQIWSVALQCQ